MKNSYCNSNCIHLDDTSSSVKAMSVYPFVFACIAMASAIYLHSSIAWGIFILLIIIGIVTLFSRGAILFDADRKSLLRYHKFLWFEFKKFTPINEFDSVELTGLACTENAPPTLCLQINRKGASNLSLQHIRLGTFDYNQLDEALQKGKEFAELLHLDFNDNKQAGNHNQER